MKLLKFANQKNPLPPRKQKLPFAPALAAAGLLAAVLLAVPVGAAAWQQHTLAAHDQPRPAVAGLMPENVHSDAVLYQIYRAKNTQYSATLVGAGRAECQSRFGVRLTGLVAKNLLTKQESTALSAALVDDAAYPPEWTETCQRWTDSQGGETQDWSYTYTELVDHTLYDEETGEQTVYHDITTTRTALGGSLYTMADGRLLNFTLYGDMLDSLDPQTLAETFQTQLRLTDPGDWEAYTWPAAAVEAYANTPTTPATQWVTLYQPSTGAVITAGSRAGYRSANISILTDAEWQERKARLGLSD